jgi:hypothetical protein
MELMVVKINGWMREDNGSKGELSEDNQHVTHYITALTLNELESRDGIWKISCYGEHPLDGDSTNKNPVTAYR